MSAPSGVRPLSSCRRHPRIRMQAFCWVDHGSRATYLKVNDVSEGGLGLTSPIPLDDVSVVNVSLTLPEGPRVDARAEVVWTRQQAATGSTKLGVRFVAPPTERDALRRAIENP